MNSILDDWADGTLILSRRETASQKSQKRQKDYILKTELLKGLDKEDLGRICREFLPHSVSDYIPDLVIALKNQIKQIIKE